MTMASPSRRERLRAATVTELKDHARRLLTTGGVPAISLRAIARDMGMTAPAIYRYFPSLDALVLHLAEDIYEELRVAVEDARHAAGADPVEQLIAMTHAFRAWSLAHPAEFGLIFGNPVPGIDAYAAAASACRPGGEAAARFGAPFLETLAHLWAQRPFPTTPPPHLAEAFAPTLGPFRLRHGEPELPVEVIYEFLAAWTRLYGMVAMEVFGHLHWAVSDVTPLFEIEVRRVVKSLGGAPA
ncbi:TetR/AcrR family transcriptional regulator [Rhizomonospora bruguierae]|uniref:TetR/AcrR family transcriptional regulator n=1 Tax=Rhizomonospora bruguierae TaxID=1581705 RepID=UPI001BCE0109|nr:TetR/AcrR family transcriptional regulator [Micromonospora sp. NBRC 107566]